MKRFMSGSLLLLAVFMLAACGSDSNNNTVTGFQITTASPLAAGTIATPYNQTIATSGGTGTLNFSVTAGTLPAGLALSTAGVLSGTPTVAATSTFTITVTDSATPANTVSKPFSLTVSTTVALDGAALYASNCAGCHGPLATSAKRGRTAAQIQAAINPGGVGAMGTAALRALTPAQVQAIATVLFP